MSEKQNAPAPKAEDGRSRYSLLDPDLWERYHRSFDLLLILLFVAGTVVAFLYGLSAGVSEAATWGGSLRGALIALAIVGAAATIGALTGFLFGLPRTLTSNELRGASAAARVARADAPGGAGAPSGTPAAGSLGSEGKALLREPEHRSAQGSYTDVNTNLEQISDWLTKIIVGIGLTAIDQIPERLDHYGENVARYFTYGGEAFAIGGSLYFLIIGFFLSYVGTRVRLSLVFTTSQRNVELVRRADVSSSAAQADNFHLAAATSPVDPAGQQVAAADFAVIDTPLTELTTLEQIRAKANASARAGRHAEARLLYEEILKQGPATADLLTDYAQVLALGGQEQEAQTMLQTANMLGASAKERSEATQKVNLAAVRSEVLAGLYGENGLDYRVAIERLDQLRSADQQVSDVWLHIWRACAFGQKYAHTSDPADRLEAVTEVRRALEIDPTRRDYLARLYNPATVLNGEDDLTSLHPDPDLEVLLSDKGGATGQGGAGGPGGTDGQSGAGDQGDTGGPG